MAFIQVEYAVGVLEGAAAGVTVTSGSRIDSKGNKVPEYLLESLSRKAMDKRIAGMMQDISLALQIYAKLQFETSGMGFARLATSQGWSGGSSEPWAPLATATLEARARKRGYYGWSTGGKNVLTKSSSKKAAEDRDLGFGLDPALAAEMREEGAANSASVSDVKPRLWTKRGIKIAVSGIKFTGKDVSVRITEATMRYNEATRPVFVISEVFMLVQKLAEKNFRNLRRHWDRQKDASFKENAVDIGSTPFSLTVGERRPFEKDKVGRPKGLGSVSKLLSNKDKARLDKGERIAKLKDLFQAKKEKRAAFMKEFGLDDD